MLSGSILLSVSFALLYLLSQFVLYMCLFVYLCVCVSLPSNARINRFSDGFFPSTSRLWNSLPSAVFPASFNLPSFKGRSITTFGTRWHDFFFITLFRYFIKIVLFFTLHFFSFSQGMQTRERAHCARSVFPFINKKKKLCVSVCIAINPTCRSYFSPNSKLTPKITLENYPN